MRNRGIPLLLLAVLLFPAMARAADVAVTLLGPDGTTPLPGVGFRWLVEEDTTKPVVLGKPAQPGVDLSLSFHTSYTPVVKAGRGTGTATIPGLDPAKRYFVSVLPDSGYSIAGVPVAWGPAGGQARIAVNALPIPTGQLSVLVYEDNNPINNAPEIPEEQGLADFSLILVDAGGTYGISGGVISQDAFGNPLGTTYNADGSVNTVGTGIVKTNANGEAVFQNLSPGKYSIQAVPPAMPAGQEWHQTATIEGTKTIDAWIKANEPAVFVEFGPPGHHVSIGFVQEKKLTTPASGKITGKVVNLHNSRPPDFTFYAGKPIEGAWIGLNRLAGNPRGMYVGPADPLTGAFSINNVPPGDYELVIWDEKLDLVFAAHNVTVPAAGGEVALLDVPVFNWFQKFESDVFYDANGNGRRDAGEVGIPGQAVNLRFRDGSIYQSLLTDPTGHAKFEEVFPFFNWLVAEVDFTRFKPTGATVHVDAGGPVDLTNPATLYGALNPLPQLDPTTGTLGDSRADVGPVLLEGFQGFLGQTNWVEWGKVQYPAGENGGIAGIVQYATTRAEDDPRYAVAEPWEPGIPRVQVNLYEANTNGTIKDLNLNGIVDLADADNAPFLWFEGGQMGPEDVKRNGDVAGCNASRACAFDLGDAREKTATDSWDDLQPEGCSDELGAEIACYDGLRPYNQVRPAVFDGGYAFGSLVGPQMVPGSYIVESVAPPGYRQVEVGDRNVDFGDEYSPTPTLLPAPCVGTPFTIPQYLTLFPGVQNPLYDAANPAKTTPSCSMKQVEVRQGVNAAANFFLYTEVPVAGHIVGIVLNDLANEFNPAAPTLGEKYSPPFLPISLRDWTGKEFSRVYTDQYGAFNALVPSTYTINAPIPSGVAPNIVTACINSPGPIPDPANPGKSIIDPHFNRQYSQFCYQLQYIPGKTTYLDTPVLPIAAFAGPDMATLDCEVPNGTPKIHSVSGSTVPGPWIAGGTSNASRTITLVSEGAVQVPNPNWNPMDPASPKTISRNYGFGPSGAGNRVSLNLDPATGASAIEMQIVAWNTNTITARFPSTTPNATTAPQQYQLTVTRGSNGQRSVTGITLTVGGPAPQVVQPGRTIQSYIDTAAADSLIIVPSGTYEEAVVMWKPIRLQGQGEGSTTINAVKAPAEKIVAWRTKVQSIVDQNLVTLLPGQPNGTGFPEPGLLATEEGPGILVLAKNASPASGGFGQVGTGAAQRPNSRIDGFTITGADTGGGIFVNGYARWLEISNNRIIGNQGFYGGGIRVGHAALTNSNANGVESYVNAQNDRVAIHNNHVAQNGGLDGAGGGISLCTGATRYAVTSNWVCGNFTSGDGGGIGHYGLSDLGLIERNEILFNQSFAQGTSPNGGGLLIAGLPALAAGALTPGSGSVTVNANRFQGNLAGAGDGGGIRLQLVNGQDVVGNANRNNPERWHKIELLNNVIVQNVAGLAGGAISMQDVARVSIVNNTIANNDSTATAGAAFSAGNPNTSNPQPAGIVSHAHSTGLTAQIGTGDDAAPFRLFANPFLVNNIILGNRVSYFDSLSLDPTTPTFGLRVLTPVPAYADLAVVGTATPQAMDPRFCLLRSTTGYHASNLEGTRAVFVNSNLNQPAGQSIVPEVGTSLTATPAFDEGGNFIDVRFSPLTLNGNYHLAAGAAGAAAVDLATKVNPFRPSQQLTNPFPNLALDWDGNARPAFTGAPWDIGADER
jgi:hypothetical protein